MDNRFGLKDFVLVVLVLVAIFSIWARMFGGNRDWARLDQMMDIMEQQQASISSYEKTVRRMSEENTALKDGVVQLSEQLNGYTESVNAMTTGVGEVQSGVGELIEVLRAGAAQGNSGPMIDGGGLSLGNEIGNGGLQGGGITFDAAANALPNGFEQRRLGTHENDDFAYGDWYVTAVGSVIPKLTPYIPGDTVGSYIQWKVIEALAKSDWDDPTIWRPMLAESGEISEDGLTVTFKLREDVRFAGGEPFTSEDVIFTYDWVMNPDIAAPRTRAYWNRIESVEATGPYEVVFKLKDSYFLGFTICAEMEILSKKYYSQFTPDEFNALPGLLYGSGPYMLQGDPRDWRPGAEPTVLIRNENYWSVKPALDRLVFKVFTTRPPMVTAFRNGEFDNLGVYADEYLNFRDDEALREGNRWLEYEVVNSGYRYLGWNTARPMFADKRVRQALTMLINREQMAERLMNGTVTVTTGPFHPLGDQDDPEIEPWPYDPDRAAALLAQAGWKDRDGDGVLENEAGERFKFAITFPASIITYRSMAEQIKQTMAQANIIVELNPQEWNSMLEKMDARDFDAISLGWGAGGPESDVYQMFHSDSIEGGGDNYISFKNEALDAAIWAARFEVDDQKRYGMWREVHQILHDEQPYTFLFNSRQIRMVDERFHNADPTTLFSFVHWDEFYVPSSQQVPRQ